MQARVQENGDTSEPFPFRHGVKQGCVLAPTLFFILFSALLLDSSETVRGVYIQFRFSGKLFNLQRLQARTKVFEALLQEFLFADDCALTATTRDDLQHTVNHFSVSCKRLGLTISLGKSEAMFQPPPSPQNPAVLPPSPVSFAILASTISSNGSLDNEPVHPLED